MEQRDGVLRALHWFEGHVPAMNRLVLRRRVRRLPQPEVIVDRLAKLIFSHTATVQRCDDSLQKCSCPSPR